MANLPLAIPRNNWRSRWLHLDNSDDIHRVAEIVWDDDGWDPDQMVCGPGTTVCGKTGRLDMPGIFSRMAAPRCKACCAALNIEEGDGAPFNSSIPEDGDQF